VRGAVFTELGGKIWHQQLANDGFVILQLDEERGDLTSRVNPEGDKERGMVSITQKKAVLAVNLKRVW